MQPAVFLHLFHYGFLRPAEVHEENVLGHVERRGCLIQLLDIGHPLFQFLSGFVHDRLLSFEFGDLLADIPDRERVVELPGFRHRGGCRPYRSGFRRFRFPQSAGWFNFFLRRRSALHFLAVQNRCIQVNHRDPFRCTVHIHAADCLRQSFSFPGGLRGLSRQFSRADGQSVLPADQIQISGTLDLNCLNLLASVCLLMLQEFPDVRVLLQNAPDPKPFRLYVRRPEMHHVRDFLGRHPAAVRQAEHEHRDFLLPFCPEDLRDLFLKLLNQIVFLRNSFRTHQMPLSGGE